MPKVLAILASLALTAFCAMPQGAVAKGVGMSAAPGGVTVTGSPYRYVAISPGFPGVVTVVERIDRDGGRVSRWWHLPGSWFVPAVAYDGSGGGLSADGTTLVLQRFTQAYPPRTTRLAILDTGPTHRNPGQRRQRSSIRFLSLRGHFAFDAISPDGSVAYLVHYDPSAHGPDYITSYEIRALDLSSGRLLPQPIVDPKEPDEQMTGLPISRATSPDGRWAYTLYDGNGNEPFIHALDTRGGSAVCIDLPQLEGRHNLFLIQLDVDPATGDITILSRSAKQWVKTRTPLLAVDAETLEVGPATASGSEEGGKGTDLPWLLIGLSVGIVAFTTIFLGRLGSRGPRRRAPKPTS